MQRTPHSRILNLIFATLLILTPIAQAMHTAPDYEQWAHETIEFPPGFALDLPFGVEMLRFPKGWRTPDSENFWSYAIVMQLDEVAPKENRLEELIDIYYTGLMSAFGVGREQGSPPNEVLIEIKQTAESTYEGTMRLIDGFATHEPITINLKVSAQADSNTTSTIEVRVSPQPTDHSIWSDLQGAIEHIHQTQRNHPLAAVAHLPRGEWRTEPTNNEREQRDIWMWGPGEQSMTSVTTNRKGTSSSIFGSFRIVYKHPQRDGLQVLALDGPELIQTGTATPENRSKLRFDMTLFYDQEKIPWAREPIRKITSHWDFDGRSQYLNHWITDQGQPVPPLMVSWRYTKFPDITPQPESASAPPDPILYMKAFQPLVGSDWVTETTRTSFSWIPYNEAVLMRTTDLRTWEFLSETVFYPHPHTKAIHAITIHDSGMVDEGLVRIDENTVHIHADRTDANSTSRIEVILERSSSDSIRSRTWSVDGSERSILADTTLTAAND